MPSSFIIRPYFLFVRSTTHSAVVMDLVVCSPTAASASTVTSSVIDDKDTEWRATREFLQTGKRIREKKHCEYCGKLYAGGPDMIRAHLLAEI